MSLRSEMHVLVFHYLRFPPLSGTHRAIVLLLAGESWKYLGQQYMGVLDCFALHRMGKREGRDLRVCVARRGGLLDLFVVVVVWIGRRVMGDVRGKGFARLPSLKVVQDLHLRREYCIFFLAGIPICYSQSPIAPIVGEEHLQKKSALIKIMSDEDPSIFKSVKNSEQQIEY